MANKYTYPRVNVTTRVISSRKPTTTVNTNTRLFVPFISSRGPENTVTQIESFSDFKNVFGELDYTKLGQEQILNIGQWFSGGGVVLAFRITDNLYRYINADIDGKLGELKPSGLSGYAHSLEKDDDGCEFVTVYAKYPGSEYNGIKVIFKKDANTKDDATLDDSIFTITVKDAQDKIIEYKRNVVFAEIERYISLSDYVGEIIVNEDIDIPGKDREVVLKLDNGSDLIEVVETTPSVTSETTPVILSTNKYANLLKDVLNYALKQPLETPCDFFIDPGYSLDVKQALLEFFCGTSDETASNFHRDDIVLLLSDVYIKNGKYSEKYTVDQIKEKRKYSVEVNGITEEKPYEVDFNYKTLKIMTHYFKATDMYSTTRYKKEVCYPLTYYAAALYPYNDRLYGRQTPLQGDTYGFIGTSNDIQWINKIPSNAEKQTYAENHLCYIEKNNDNYVIMLDDSQFVNDDYQETVLRQMSRVRATIQIQRDLKAICHPYIGKPNDAILKKELANKCSAYLDTWIKNRTLEIYELSIYNPHDLYTLDNNEILVTLDIKFNHVLEIINLDFTVM